jgi:hypothetical protein
MEISDAIVAGDRPTDEVQRKLMASVLERDHADEMEAVGMVRLDGENLPVMVLGLRKLASAVQAYAIGQDLACIQAHVE